MNNTFEMYFFGGNKWKSFCQIKTHLITKNTDGSGAGSVGFLRTVIENMLQELMVWLHGRKLQENARDGDRGKAFVNKWWNQVHPSHFLRTICL